MVSKFFLFSLSMAQLLVLPDIAMAASAMPPPMEQQSSVADGYIKELRSFMVGKGYGEYKNFIISKLDAKDYSTLDGYFGVLQKAYEDGKIDDIELRYAFSTLDNLSALKYETIFDGWVQKYPNSYAAKIAWAQYHYAVAWGVRGKGNENTPAPDIKDAKLNTFYRELTLAQLGYGEAVKLSLKPTLGYSGLIATNGETSGKLIGGQDISVILANANGADPQNFLARQQYIRFLQPQWHGSFEKMTEFVDHEQNAGLEKNRANLLRSKIYIERGNSAYYNDKDLSAADGWYRTAYQLQEPYKYLPVGQEGLIGLIRIKEETARNNIYPDELVSLLNDLLDKSGYVENEGTYQTMRGRVYVARANKSQDADDFKRAFASFYAGAQVNDPYSLFRLGSTYCEGFPGLVIQKNEAACKDLMTKSSNLGLIEASIVLKTKWGVTPENKNPVQEFVGLTHAGQNVPEDSLPKPEQSAGVMDMLGRLL